jgi:hypothetical protein
MRTGSTKLLNLLSFVFLANLRCAQAERWDQSAVSLDHHATRNIMRHPQRLDIRFLGTQIRAEGVLGILGALMIVTVFLSLYFKG